eukprot:716365-Lingulodinium_polyedra.AAC.1
MRLLPSVQNADGEAQPQAGARPTVSQDFVAQLVADFVQLFGQQQTGTPHGFPIASVVMPDRQET